MIQLLNLRKQLIASQDSQQAARLPGSIRSIFEVIFNSRNFNEQKPKPEESHEPCGYLKRERSPFLSFGELGNGALWFHAYLSVEAFCEGEAPS